MRLELPQVALVCCDTRDARLSLESMHRSIEKVAFGECIYVTCAAAMEELPAEFTVHASIRIEIIEPFTGISDYSMYILRWLHALSQKPFYLISQWDSWVLSAQSWQPDFLNYDYIGAVWPHHKERKVGNGGFSLRSRNLMVAVASLVDHAAEHTLKVEDDFICRTARFQLESGKGLRFAPESLANSFSAERMGWDEHPFGFHGLLNFGRIFDTTEFQQRLASMPKFYFGDRHSFDLVKYLISSRRHLDAIYVISRRIELTGWTTKNAKLFFHWLTAKLMDPKTFFQSGGKTTG